ncbi:SDR family NAD(P)-dependent oxidoreductase [Rhodoferax sp. UBA5149]|uniref:SDR family NAD(P)-dependent oxidoreductase n=1 Tax=Rhodoferax sp. UBA5149 TaxID=1947379 RepID=UPI0025D98783|nr:glucose 1-dehydrogenase [Rhodoferax sp. UBA5149]
MSEFSGRVAVVTGSTSGIGEAIARRLSELGASVVINSASSVEAGEKLAKELGDNALYVQADISDKASGERLLAATLQRFGKLDILVNNAGWTTVVPHHDLEALTDDIFTRTFDVNVIGTWILTKAAMPYLKQSDDGNVVNITSVAGVRPVGSSIAYSMTKAALNHMTLLLAKSCGPVRVNAVAPGLVETPWTKDWQAQHDGVKAMAPLKRSATPDDCVQATLGLLRTRYATGQIFVVDGGLTLVL